MIAIGPAPLARRSRIPAAAAVRTRDDFEQMPVRVFKVETAPTVVVVGLPPAFVGRGQPSKASSVRGCG